MYHVALIEYTNNAIYLGAINVSTMTTMTFAKAAVKQNDSLLSSQNQVLPSAKEIFKNLTQIILFTKCNVQ